jgi:hypothetical protein
MCLGCTPPGSTQACFLDGCPPAYRQCIGAFPYAWGACTCPLPPIRRTAYPDKCGEIYGRWDVPRGGLALINDDGPDAIIKPIVSAIGETYTHEFVAESPDIASHSTAGGPRRVDSCTRPIVVGDLERGHPGMTGRLNMGAVYNQIYGTGERSGVRFGEWQGNDQAIWHLGDTNRANAIADAVQATGTFPYGTRRSWCYAGPLPSSLVSTFPDSCGDYSDYPEWLEGYLGCPYYTTVCDFPVHRLNRNGDVSPYVLYQFVDIQGTHLGSSGSSIRNGSMSASYCAYAYALGGPPMTPFRYEHAETRLAAFEFWNKIFRTCLAGVGWLERLFCGGGDVPCTHAANMVVNCMANDSCGDNTYTWQESTTQPSDFRAWTISPDRLGGHSARFAAEVAAGNPPTTWSADTVTHYIRWNAAGPTFGCWH